MHDKVSAKNVCELTAAHAFSHHSAGTPPTSEYMIDQISRNIYLKNKSLAKIKEQQGILENIIENVPDGFCLTPVWYSRIENEQNSDVRKEYNKNVRRAFLNYLATHHAEELSTLGICENGIACMKRDTTPVNTDGMLYDVTIVHIVEKFGGGLFSEEKEIDPLRPDEKTPTFIVNHFNNLILLPEKIHQFKNTLNRLQNINEMKPGEVALVLTLIPETNGFVSPPQTSKHHLYGIKMRPPTLDNKKNHTRYMISRALEALTTFQDETISRILLPAEIEARKDSLSMTFDKAIIDNPKLIEILNTDLIPTIDTVTTQLKDIFEMVSSPERSSGEYKNFLRFYNGQDVTKLRSKIKALPINEAIEANNFFNGIDSAILARFNQRAERKEERRVYDEKSSIFFPVNELPTPAMITPDIIVTS